MPAMFSTLFVLVAMMFALVVMARTLQESWVLVVAALRGPVPVRAARRYRVRTVNLGRSQEHVAA